MVVVTLDRLDPFGEEALPCRGLCYIKSPVSCLPPNKISHLVCVIKKSLFKYLLMKSCAVISHVDRALNVSYKLRVGGSGENSVRIEALVENKSLEYGSAVDIYFLVIYCNFTHSEVALYLVIAHFKGEVVKLGCENIPKVKLGQLYCKKSVRLNYYTCAASYFFTVVVCCCCNSLSVCVYAVCVDIKALVCKRRCALGFLYVCVRYVFKPNCLPDTCCTGIKTTE